MTTGGRNVVAHAGARLLVDLAEDLGLTKGLSVAMAPTRKRCRGHDRGAVLVDLAVALAGGGRTISDLRTLIDQPSLFGEVASVSTAWRTLDAVDDATLKQIARALAKARAKAWAAGMDPGFYVIDIDGTLVTSHSEKERAAPNYKHSFGFYPLMSYLDATGEHSRGSCGRGTRDRGPRRTTSVSSTPRSPSCRWSRKRPSSSAGATRRAAATPSWRPAASATSALSSVTPSPQRSPNAVVFAPGNRWIPAIGAGGAEEADWAEVSEVSDLLDLCAWPEGTRAIARREVAHPGAQLTFTDFDGRRYQLFVTDH